MYEFWIIYGLTVLIYLFGVIWLYAGLGAVGELTPKRKRFLARLVFLTPLAPVNILIFTIYSLVRGITALFRTAFGKVES